MLTSLLCRKKILRQLLKPYAEFLAARNMTIREELVKSKISNAKAKGITADLFAGEIEERLRRKGDSLENMLPQDIQEKITGQVYEEYEKLLRRNNAMDFDDLLLYGVRLFKQRREAVAWCEHVLVDELYVPIFLYIMDNNRGYVFQAKIPTLFNMTSCSR